MLFKCASGDEWINKCGLDTGRRFHSALIGKEFLIHATMLLNVENTELSRINHTQKKLTAAGFISPRCLEESGSEAIEWDWQGLKRQGNCFLRIGFPLRK